MKFREDYGVYICSHIFEGRLPVLEAIRDPEGHWQMFCGEDHDMEVEDCHLVGVGHLIREDSTINDLTVLKPLEFAERESSGATWEFGVIDE